MEIKNQGGSLDSSPGAATDRTWVWLQKTCAALLPVAVLGRAYLPIRLSNSVRTQKEGVLRDQFASLPDVPIVMPVKDAR